MAQDIIARLSRRSRSLPPIVQLSVVGILVALSAIGIVAGAMIGRVVADTSAGAQNAGATAAAGAFKPTTEQWAGIKVETVAARTFVPARVTEGNIAIDEDLTTPVFSPYSGRVIRLIARLGDHVARGAPLMAVEATEFVQAQNDLITAAATLKTARAQLRLAGTAEQRQHQLYLGKGAALKDWQQSQTDLAAAQNNLRAQQIALAAVRNRLRISAKATRKSPISKTARPRPWSPSLLWWRRSAAP